MALKRNASGLGRFAPYACAALLAGLFFAGGLNASTPHGAEDYMGRVRKVIDTIPYKVGPTVGNDVEPTKAAILLLSPNKLFQRRYIDPATGWGMSLLIVHCKDVRDMTGHYPPVCYPAHGWKQVSTEQSPITVNGEDWQAMVYRFSRSADMSEHRMIVLDFFIIPEGGGTIFADMAAMDRAARASKVGGLGVAQVQIVLDEDASPQWRDAMVKETLHAIAPALKTIGQGVQR
ncbi:MAG TPA: exosortase-associated EpsI family protein [Phycisphaerales bacterium]|nr:exosortase-associated EpsI family protein [Phycisphaerales bacterium]